MRAADECDFLESRIMQSINLMLKKRLPADREQRLFGKAARSGESGRREAVKPA